MRNARRTRADLIADLRENEARYRSMAENASDVIAEVDASGRFLFVSPNSASILGRAADDLIGRTPLDGAILESVHPEDRERVLGSFRPGAPSGTESRVEYRYRLADGSWRWFESRARSYRAADGAGRFVVISRDVTEQVCTRQALEHADAERRKLEERVQRAQRLECLGVMAGGIAHDFNNLLTPILGDASLALLDLPADSPLRARLENIRKAARRAAVLTGQMLTYTGQETLQPECLDLSRVVRDLGPVLESAVSKKAVLDLDLAPDLPPVWADACQLAQVTMNLVANASEALGHAGGRIALGTGSADLPGAALAECVLGEDLPGGRYVHLEVSDTGCGMDPQTLARIFDPFYTTKFTGRGLGLAAVLGIVRSHRGALEIESEPGRGTRVRVLLPASAPPSTSPPGHPRGT